MTVPITRDPIPTPIPKSKRGISFETIAKISNDPSMPQSPPRLNFLPPPKDGSRRLFINDMRGKLYVLGDGEISLYLDLAKAIGDSFISRGGQQGFICVTLDPDFGRNAIIHTVHTEYKGEVIPDCPVTKPIFNNSGQ